MKDFFNIKTDKYRFEIYDLTAIFTIVNVVLIVMGYWSIAPIFGLINCIICLVISIKNHLHINNYLTQLALIILNLYFLLM